ncbi:MAG TPA: hypothetical protein VMY59_07790, partial [Candidatus Thermoplasmatota archaeon]|nr:hypothetical protein [Candidatus Thermoplasmatota archaeon]
IVTRETCRFFDDIEISMDADEIVKRIKPSVERWCYSLDNGDFGIRVEKYGFNSISTPDIKLIKDEMSLIKVEISSWQMRLEDVTKTLRLAEKKIRQDIKQEKREHLINKLQSIWDMVKRRMMQGREKAK